MDTYPYQLAAGEALEIPGVGNLVACLDSDYGFSLTTDNRSTMEYRQGLQVRYPKSFESVRVVNGSKAQKITLLIGFGDASLPIPSVVEVIDGGLRRTQAGNSYQGYVGAIPIAAQYGHSQLWNPVGSGFEVVVKSIRCVDYTGAGTISLLYTNAALTTPAGTLSNKYVGQPLDSTTESYNQNSATQLTGSSFILSLNVEQNKLAAMPFPDEPIVLPPGQGVMLRVNVVNHGLRGYFDYFKVPA